MPSLNEIQKKWEGRIKRAKTKREMWQREFSVEKTRAYFRGKQNEHGVPESEWITVNKIYSHLMAQLPAMYSVDPYFYVGVKRSYTPDPQQIALFEYRAKVRQAFLNYLKSEIGLKEKTRMAILDSYFAYGVCKVRYQADNVKNPDAGNAIMSEAGEPLLGEEGMPLKEPDTIPVNERYVLDWIYSDDFLWSEDSGCLPDKWEWVAQRIKMTKDQAKKDKRISKAALKTAETQDRDKEKNYPTSFSDHGDGASKEREVYVIWEIYDLEENEWLIIAEDAEEPLMKPTDLPAGIEKHPFAILRFVPQEESSYPIPPIYNALAPQREYNMVRSKVLTHRKRFNRKYEVFSDGLEDADMSVSMLESGDDGTIIRKRTPQRVVEPIQDAPLDQQLYSEISLLNQDLAELIGTSDEARAVASADTATQAGIMDKHMEIREGDRLSLVADFVTEIAKKIDQLVQANISRDEAVYITGPQGNMWQQVRVDDYDEISGEFKYTVNVGATQPRLPAVERSQWLGFLNLLTQFPHLLTSQHFMKEMARMHNIEDEIMLQELQQIGQQIMQGQSPMPGGASQPGQSIERPGTVTGGQAGGQVGVPLRMVGQ